MNPCLCLKSGIHSGQLWVSLIIFIPLSGPRCWQWSLLSCPHMPSFYLGHFSAPTKFLQPKQIPHFLLGSRSVPCRSPPGPLHFIVTFLCIPGEAGGGGTTHNSLVVCADFPQPLNCTVNSVVTGNSLLLPTPSHTDQTLDGLWLYIKCDDFSFKFYYCARSLKMFS